MCISWKEIILNELEIVEHRQVEGLSIFFDTVDYRTAHFHTEWELLWVLDQPLCVTDRQGLRTLQPGELTLFAPNEPHEFHKLDRQVTFLCVQISSKRLPSLPPIILDGNITGEHFSEAELSQIKHRIAVMTEIYLHQQGHYGLYCAGECCLLLHRLLSKLPHRVLTPEEASCISKKNARMERLIRFVDENYMHKIRLTDFAEAEQCSVSYLSRFIKETMNQSFQDYVTSVRFNCACKLIAAGGMKMLDVCMESGFSDYRYFSRAFQQQYHMTPEEYSGYKRSHQTQPAVMHHSLHSIERFYSRDDSLKLLQQYMT